MAPKKGRRAKRDDDDSDEDLKTVASASTEAADAEKATAPVKRTSKKKQAKKKSKAIGDWSDDDEVVDPLATDSGEANNLAKPPQAAGFAALGAEQVEGEEEEEEEAAFMPQAKTKNNENSAAASFAALSLDDDPEAEAEEEYDAEAAGEEGTVEKSKHAASGFAALNLDEVEGAGDEAEAIEPTENGRSAQRDQAPPAAKPLPAKKGKKGKGKKQFKADFDDDYGLPAPSIVVASVSSVELHPNADKLKVCSINTGTAVLKVVTNALTVREGMKVAFAGMKCTTPGSGIRVEQATLRGVESFGMLCSAYDLGWCDEPDGILVELPQNAEEGEEVPDSPMEGAIYGDTAAPSPAAKGKKKSKKDVGFADLAEAGAEEASEGPAVTATKQKRSKKKKTGFDPSTLSVEDEEPQAEPQAEEAVANGAAAEAETSISGAADAPEPLLTGKKKKKSKASTFDPDALLAAATASTPEHDASPAEEAPLPDNKKKGKQANFDMEAVLAEAAGEAPSTSASATHLPADGDAGNAIEDEAKKGGKKKGKSKTEGEEEDLDALLAEFGVNTDAVAEGKKSKKKKKGKAGAGEPPQAADEEGPSTSNAEALPEQEGTEAAVPDESARDAEPANEADPENANGDGKELSAAQKKKLKKKAKEKAKKTGGGEDEEDASAPSKKGPAKKESAAVRRLREEMERQRAAQEAAEKAEQERIRKEEEEARRAEEEALRREEEKKRRKEEKVKQRAELKRQGLLKTGKEKQEAERLAAMREQFLKNNPGLELPAAGESQHKKRVVYGKKKPPKKDSESSLAAKQQQEAEEAARKEAEDARQREEEERLKAEEEAKARAAAEAAAAEEAEDGDSVGWEELDADQIMVPGQALSTAEEAGVDEEEEGSPAAEKSLPNGKAKGEPLKAPEPKKAKVEATPSQPAETIQESEDESSSEAEDEAASEDDESSSEASSEESSSSEYTDSEDESVDSEEAREERVRAARAARAEKMAAARQAGSTEDLRSPICCILGHVDTGKTKLLDNIRRTSVQEGEAGGITQQIGATYVPGEAIKLRTEPVRKGREFGLKLPGLLIIDTPGHESFTNLRSRGSSLCDIAILVVDIMHGLEPQTIESINLLKQKKTPFIVALNKVDRLFEWQAQPNAGIQDALAAQQPHVKAEFEKNMQRATLNLNEQGLNVALYWKNPDPRKYVNIVPTSAITGEGLPDMLQLLVQLTQKMMAERLMFISELQCTVLEVKVIEGLGTTIDVVLVNGVLREGDQIVLCGLQGPIVTTIRSLLTPHPLKELRVRGSYLHHKEIKAAQGIKIAAQNLENAVAGTQMLVVQKGDSVDDLKEEVMGDMVDIFKSVDKSGEGVCVQASTLGSLEALLEFLRSEAVRIPVSGINIGPVHKRDVMRASTMLEKGRKKYAVILAFDVPVTREAQEQANSTGVRIFTADIIYHLFDQFSAYLKQAKEEEQQAAAGEAVFPVILQILQNCIFNTKDPIVLGCTVEEGIAKVGTPLCVPSKGGFLLGKIASMELNHKPVDIARQGDSIAMKIEATNAEESAKLYGRHFDFHDKLVSKISRRSIDLLKLHFKDDLERDDWRLVVKLKKMFGID